MRCQQPFAGQVFLITGASSGIGCALARAAACQGGRVALLARNRQRLESVAQDIARAGGEAWPVVADVCHTDEVAAAVKATLDRFGQIDVLVNNAGQGLTGRVDQTSLNEFRELIETHFFGALRVVQAALPQMMARRTGLIIQMSSVNGFCAVPLGSAYSASKFALEALSESLRVELQPYGIRVLVVRPGVTDTEFFDRAKRFREQNPFPLRRLMSADTVARKTLAAAAAHRRDLVLTAEGKLLWWLKKFAPAMVDRILQSYIKPHDSKPAVPLSGN